MGIIWVIISAYAATPRLGHNRLLCVVSVPFSHRSTAAGWTRYFLQSCRGSTNYTKLSLSSAPFRIDIISRLGLDKFIRCLPIQTVTLYSHQLDLFIVKYQLFVASSTLFSTHFFCFTPVVIGYYLCINQIMTARWNTPRTVLYANHHILWTKHSMKKKFFRLINRRNCFDWFDINQIQWLQLRWLDDTMNHVFFVGSWLSD